MQTVWKKLTEGVPSPQTRWMAVVLGSLSALAMPVFLTLLGWLTNLLFASRLAESGKRVLPEELHVGQWLKLPSSWLTSDKNILRCAITLVVALCVVLVIERLSLLFSRRGSLKASLHWTSAVLKKIFVQARRLSFDQGLAGQRKVIRDLIQTDVPRVRDALMDWYRVFPRNLIQIVAVVILASCVHVWLTMLAILALVMVWGLFITLEAAQRKRRPVLIEQRRNAHEHLIYLSESSPLLESVDRRVDVEQLFDRQLSSFNRAQLNIADEGTLRAPSLLLTVTVLGAFLLFVLAVRVLEPGATLHVGDIVTLVGCVVVAVNGIFRLRRGFRKSNSAVSSAEHIARYLSIQGSREEPGHKGLPAIIKDNIVFEYVSFRDSAKHRILEDVSLELKPGLIHAIVSIENATAQTLTEMVLGFGLPSSGRILINNVNLIDIDPQSIRSQSLLINETGPLLDGSVEENLWSGATRDATVDAMEFAKRSNVAEAILNLPDGIGTVLSSNDERLTPDQLYRVGIVRALLKKPHVVVAHEPRIRVSVQEENDSLAALRQLRDMSSILIVLPERLSTLRNADKIFMFKDGKLVASGTHQTLLEESDIYRHFNYMRFALVE